MSLPWFKQEDFEQDDMSLPWIEKDDTKDNIICIQRWLHLASVMPVASPAARGGHRQRASYADTADTTVRPLNDKLAYDWARGGVKSSQLQSYALRAQSQGATGCEDLAAAGSRGCHRGNLFRSLSRLITAPAAPTVEWFVIPTKTGPQP